MVFIIKDNEDNEQKKKKPSNKDIWIETIKEIKKWLKKIFGWLMKIGKWVSETMMKIMKALWEYMENRFGE
jgi:hypothetical protein